MTSAKSYDFLSELKATLSKLTAQSETTPSELTDVPESVTDCLQQTPQLNITENTDNHHDDDNETRQRGAEEGQLGSDMEPTGACPRSVLYGELSSVLEKRGQQQQQQQHPTSRVIDLESRLRPGKSVVYLGSRGHRSDSVATAAEPQQSGGSDDAAVTSRQNVMTSEEENNSDVISTSSAVDVSHVCPSSNHGTQDSACVMSADESAESSDCSLLVAHDNLEQQPQQQQECDRDKSLESDHQDLTAGLSSEDDDRYRPQRHHFATFPLIRPTPTLTCRGRTTPMSTVVSDESTVQRQRHDDIITTLMITHSGEPISVGLNHHDSVADRPLSVPVTVPGRTAKHLSTVFQALFHSEMGQWVVGHCQ